MAAPLPKPVEPIFSRPLNDAAICLAGRPVSRAAAAASCWNRAFLFAAATPASIASIVNMSERSFIMHRRRPRGPVRVKRVGGGRLVALRLDPADRPVASSVHHVEVAGAAVAEQQGVGVA